jgi:hypothetical protein
MYPLPEESTASETYCPTLWVPSTCVDDHVDPLNVAILREPGPPLAQYATCGLPLGSSERERYWFGFPLMPLGVVLDHVTGDTTVTAEVLVLPIESLARTTTPVAGEAGAV